jgi:hypothetical protein
MQLQSSLGQRLARRWTAALITTAAAGLIGCQSGDQTGTTPTLPQDPGGNPGLKQSAFIFDVDTRSGTVTVSQPIKNLTMGSAIAQGAIRGPAGISYSILAGDAITLTTSNFFASTVGQYTAGKVRVKFDVNITNKLGSVELITPTFPTPPTGIKGVFLFPFQTVVTTTSGGTSVGGDGTDVIIELPSYGLVAPSIDWNGNATDATSAPGGDPFNFFNDTGCGAGSNDCYRYEVFGEALSGGELGIPAAATSTARTVGFDIDPTVGNFRARLIVAADLRNASGSAPVGTVAGVVSSPQRGNLSGVTVNVSGGFSAATAATTGAYSIANIPTGPHTVSLTAASLPAGCTAPASQSATVSNGVTSTVNFSVTCTVPVGTISGTITNSVGGTISGTLTVTPTGLAAQPGVAFTGTSPVSYTASNVPVGTGAGSIALTGLPAQCTNPGAIPYTGLTSGGTLTVNVTVTCTVPPSFYQVTHTWSGTGSTRTLTIRIDMTTRNDPAVNGASPDDIGAFQGTLIYDAAKLTPVSGNEAATSSPRLGNVVANYATSGQIVYGSFDAVAGGRLGNVGIIQLDFTVVGTPAGGSTTSVTTQLQSGATNYGQSSAASGSVNYGPAVIQINAGTLTF